jgi:hypothetical protein
MDQLGSATEMPSSAHTHYETPEVSLVQNRDGKGSGGKVIRTYAKAAVECPDLSSARLLEDSPA